METIKNYIIRERPQLKDIDAVFKELKPLFSQEKEYFIILNLDTKNKVIRREIVNIGTLNQCSVSPATVFKTAIKLNANRIIAAHNHPSGDTTPSEDDIKICERLKRCGELLNIEVLDNVIFSGTEIKSITEA